MKGTNAMDIKSLQSALSHAAALLRAGGGKPQAKALADVSDLLGSTGDATVGEFISKTKEALTPPPPPVVSSRDIAQRLHRAGTDKAAFEEVYAQLTPKDVVKLTVLEAAQYYIGSPKTTWKSKPQALKAIRAKFDERVFMDQRSQANAAVTPW